MLERKKMLGEGAKNLLDVGEEAEDWKVATERGFICRKGAE